MKTGSVPFDKNDLGTTVAVDPPVTNPGDASKVFTYSLTATNNLSGTSAGITATATSFPSGADLASPRIGSTSTLLPNGKVLIVGGGASISKGICTYSATTGNPGDSDTAEIYDPAAGTITAVPSALVSSRCLHTAVFVATTGNIHTGKVFIIGGANDATASKNVKIDVFLYNDATANVFGAWQSTTLPVMQVARVGHSATLLGSNAGSNNGKIIIAGGYQPGYTQTTGSGLDTAELFDPAGGSGNGTSALYSGTGSNFLAGRGEHAAVLAGKWLLIIGGYSPSANAGVGNFSPSVDAIDTTVSAATNNPFAQTGATTMTGFANPAVGRFGHSAIALNATAILVAGGVPDRSGSVRASMQKYTLNQSSGLITGTGAPVNFNTGRARFQLLAAGPVNKYLAFGGSSAISNTSAIDTATNSVEVVTADTGSTLATANSGTMASARQALTATNLKLSGASNFTFLIAGGAAAVGGAELFHGPGVS